MREESTYVPGPGVAVGTIGGAVFCGVGCGQLLPAAQLIAGPGTNCPCATLLPCDGL